LRERALFHKRTHERARARMSCEFVCVGELSLSHAHMRESKTKSKNIMQVCGRERVLFLSCAHERERECHARVCERESSLSEMRTRERARARMSCECVCERESSLTHKRTREKVRARMSCECVFDRESSLFHKHTRQKARARMSWESVCERESKSENVPARMYLCFCSLM